MRATEHLTRSKEECAQAVLTHLRRANALHSVSELRWYFLMEAQAETVVTALAWALEEDCPALGLELSVLMARYWWVLGTRSEGRAWLSAFLGDAQDADADLVGQAQAWLLELAGEDKVE